MQLTMHLWSSILQGCDASVLLDPTIANQCSKFRLPPKFENFENNNLNIFKSIFKNSLKINFGRNFAKFVDFDHVRNFFSNKFQNPGHRWVCRNLANSSTCAAHLEFWMFRVQTATMTTLLIAAAGGWASLVWIVCGLVFFFSIGVLWPCAETKRIGLLCLVAREWSHRNTVPWSLTRQPPHTFAMTFEYDIERGSQFTHT